MAPKKFSVQYSKLPYQATVSGGDDDTESFLAKEEVQQILDDRQSQRNARFFTAPNIILLVVVALAASLMGFLVGRQVPANLDSTCARHTSKYSPILDDYVVTYDWVEFDGRFTQENVYRQSAGPEVDAAWKALGVHYLPMLLPDESAERAGLTRNHTRQNPKYGGGYPVFMEGLHHLHCLNLIRQSLYYNYDYYLAKGQEAFHDPPDVLRLHVSHCVDILRQRLMCTVDTSVFGSVWINRTHPQPFVDFNNRHVCKNFDAIRAWAEARQLPESRPADFWELPGGDVYVWEEAP